MRSEFSGSGTTRCPHLKLYPGIRCHVSPRSSDRHADDSKPQAYNTAVVQIKRDVINMLVVFQDLHPRDAGIRGQINSSPPSGARTRRRHEAR